MYPELADLLEAMCDLMLVLATDPNDEQRIDSACEQVKTARAALRLLTGMEITR